MWWVGGWGEVVGRGGGGEVEGGCRTPDPDPQTRRFQMWLAPHTPAHTPGDVRISLRPRGLIPTKSAWAGGPGSKEAALTAFPHPHPPKSMPRSNLRF